VYETDLNEDIIRDLNKEIIDLKTSNYQQAENIKKLNNYESELIKTKNNLQKLQVKNLFLLY
jgi:hypothetical protein